MVAQAQAASGYLSNQTEMEMLNRRIDDLRNELKDDLKEIKDLLKSHLDSCDKKMCAHDEALNDLNQTKWKVIAFSGAVAFISAVGFKIIFH